MTRGAGATGTSVRPAGRADVPGLATLLATAFDGYAWTRWTVEAADHARRLRELYEVYLDVALRFGEVWTTGDAAGAAAWTWSEDAAAASGYLRGTGLDARVGALTGDRLEQAALAERLLAPAAPREPHWHLQALGVLPEQRNRGLGTRLLQPVLERCDAEGRAAALQTSAPDNVRLYRRMGFHVRDEIEMPDGPRVWLMWRAPGGGGAPPPSPPSP